MKDDKRGFAIAGILYSIFVLFLIIMISVLQIFQNRGLVVEKYKEEVKTKLETGS